MEHAKSILNHLCGVTALVIQEQFEDIIFKIKSGENRHF